MKDIRKKGGSKGGGGREGGREVPDRLVAMRGRREGRREGGREGGRDVPDQLVAMMGVSMDIASTWGRPHPSPREGRTKTSAA